MKLEKQLNREAHTLKDRRVALHKTQEDVALFLGVTRQTYIKWEEEPDSMPLGKFYKLLRQLDKWEKIADGN